MKYELISVLELVPSDVTCAQRIVLVVLLLCDGEAGKCYLSTDAIAARAGLSSRRTVDQLNALRERGLITRRSAADEPSCPKAQGWIYTVNVEAIAQLETLTQRQGDEVSLTQRHPDEADAKRRPAKKNLEDVKTSEGCHTVTLTQRPPSTTVLTTTKNTKGGDQSTSSATSRACAPAREEPTYSAPPSSLCESDPNPPHEQTPPAPIDRAAVAAIKQALEHALPTLELSGVKGLYALCQQILTARGGLDEARLYIEQRGLEWTQRLLDGQRYPAYAIVRLIAKDAPSWRPAAAAKAAHPTHAAPPQAAQDRALPPWWGALLKALYETFKAHRHHDTERSREGARQLGCLLHHLSRVHDVCLEGGLLTLTIEGSGPDPDSFELASSFVLHILQNHERLPITHLLYRRASTSALLHAS